MNNSECNRNIHGFSMESKTALPMFEYERKLFQNGVKSVAGVDEAGRGPLAGPVVAAAVVLPFEWYENGLPESLAGLNDSKQLSERRREMYFEEIIRMKEILYGVGIVEAQEIDSINILNATLKAMTLAINRLPVMPEHILIDGNRGIPVALSQTPVVKGDSKSFSIAAASIIAKVTRDRIMLEYDKKYPSYGFSSHKGYGTAEHLESIRRLGPCPIHRKSFAPLNQIQLTLF
ncbi:MAG: ribonuclease HII [Verrucomicrobiae bacterium]|nr:ribonuclease HII [Verrucomicrobiae bacterium]